MGKLKKLEGFEDVICTLYAQGVPFSKMKETLALSNVIVCVSSLSDYFRNPQHSATIQKYFQKYVSDPTAVRLAHKRIRLDDMDRERVSIIATLQNFKNEKGEILDKKHFKYLSMLKRLLEIEVLGRDEVEKKEIPWREHSPLDEVSNDEIVRELAEIDKRLIAARSGSQTEGNLAEGVANPSQG